MQPYYTAIIALTTVSKDEFERNITPEAIGALITAKAEQLKHVLRDRFCRLERDVPPIESLS